MSDSYTVIPLREELRGWLADVGFVDLPNLDGRDATIGELREAIASLSDIVADWSNGPDFPDAVLSTSSGLSTTVIIGGVADSEVCEFHFRGGNATLVVDVATALSRVVGPLVIHSHSGSFTKVVHALPCGT